VELKRDTIYRNQSLRSENRTIFCSGFGLDAVMWNCGFGSRFGCSSWLLVCGGVCLSMLGF
jgi:hypothetical protein